MTHNEISGIIVDAAIHIHKELGPGLMESVYKAIMIYELRKRGLVVEDEFSIPVKWDEIVIQEGFRADLLVESKVMVELKSVEKLVPVFAKKLNTQLRLSHKKLGLLINFGEAYLKDGIVRIVNGLQDGE